jgi:dTDP-4-amino-4,6-dideoxygalactose transaminase
MDAARLAQFARENGIALIEDAAHAAGMLDNGQWAGVQSSLAAYSFYATKNVTTAEGGVLVTNDDEIAGRVRALSLHGMDKDAWKRYAARGSWRYDVREPGFKYNMPDISAALGIVQMQRLETMQHRREQIARRYVEGLAGVPGVTFQAPPQGRRDRHSWCMFVLKIDPKRAGITRDALIEELKARNIGTSVHYIPTHHFSAYRSLARDLSVTEQVWSNIISLPLYPGMSDADADDVINAVKSSIPAQNQADAMLAS